MALPLTNRLLVSAHPRSKSSPWRRRSGRRKHGGDFGRPRRHQLVHRALAGNRQQLLTLRLGQVAAELSRRLTRTFLRDDNGRRPVYGSTEKFQSDPHWRDLLTYFEYFHGDNGAGLGASHQTGWTGLVAKLIEQSGE